MISVELAYVKIFEIVSETTKSEMVPLSNSLGRILADKVKSQRNLPPFTASAMDGYALHEDDVFCGSKVRIIGESSAGNGYRDFVHRGETVRIFTGAPVPLGTNKVIPQESTKTQNGWMIVDKEVGPNNYIRPEGFDYLAGYGVDEFQLITPELLLLISSMNHPEIPVITKPTVAIIPTGDELRMPGDAQSADTIVASTGFGLLSLLKQAGANPHLMPISSDSEASLHSALKLCEDFDIIVTLGGASVGDHDLVLPVASKLGLNLAFHKVAVQPGKPLLAGKLFGKPFFGLPGNPVSAMTCTYLFLIPAIMSILRLGQLYPKPFMARLEHPLEKSGRRKHYMRAVLDNEGDEKKLFVYSQQDSSLISVLAKSNALVVRPPFDGSKKAGEKVKYINIHPFLHSNYDSDMSSTTSD